MLSVLAMVHRSLVSPLVVVFWFLTSGWLVVTKILPEFQAGPAPDSVALCGADGSLVPIGWTVNWNDREVGWSLTIPRRSADGGLTVDTRLHCDRLPLDEVLPRWFGALVRDAIPPDEPDVLDVSGRVILDASGRLRSFTSTVTLCGVAPQVALEGRVVDGNDVTVTVSAGAFREETTLPVPDRAVVGDELSPLATLRGLYSGRRWTVPVYSPLRPAHTPLEILHAEVGSEQTIFWDNRLVMTRVVTYRDDPSSPREPRCRQWVDRSGRVLWQESTMFNAKIKFVRHTDAEARRLAAQAVHGAAVPAPATPAAVVPAGEAS